MVDIIRRDYIKEQKLKKTAEGNEYIKDRVKVNIDASAARVNTKKNPKIDLH